MIYKPNKKRRLDQTLVDLGLTDSLKAAQALIMAGKVVVNDQRCDKAGVLISPGSQIRLRDQRRFVSRGGDKLESALIGFGLTKAFQGARIMDIGASTGGFTDCLLQYGATAVLAVDVGHQQLAWSLRQDPRVTVLEHTDIRHLMPEQTDQYDWIVGDISFTPLAPMIPHLLKFQPNQGFILLIKPQFEIPPGQVPEGGVVTSVEAHKRGISSVQQALHDAGCRPGKILPCDLKGRKGNQEYFIYISRQ